MASEEAQLNVLGNGVCNGWPDRGHDVGLPQRRRARKRNMHTWHAHDLALGMQYAGGMWQMGRVREHGCVKHTPGGADSLRC